jgi:digeranylgeranylglycerophospholipid reductase
MKAASDAIIVGGGPCGSFAALNLAGHGAIVTVFEEHDEIGIPSHCPGHLSIKGLKRLGLYPMPKEIIENKFYGAVLHSPKGRSFSIRFSQPITCTVDRVLFDRYVAQMAQNVGASYHLNSRVESLIIEDGVVNGITIKKNGDKEEEFAAKIVIDAEGVSSRILRQSGLCSLKRQMLVNAVHAEVENVKDAEEDMVEVFLGKDYAPGFYAWFIPKGDGKAKIGLATETGNPKELLQRLMLKHPVASKKLRLARVLRTVFHPISLCGPIAKTYSDGFLTVGDAASQVKPTTGGGVILGMTCAKVATRVAYEAFQRNDFSAEFLSAYQTQYKELLGFDMNVMLRIRKMLDAMSDEKLDNAIGFLSRIGADKALRSIGDLDFQGQALIRALRYPQTLTALVYFCLLYLL